MTGGDPLAGLDRPAGSASAMHGLGSTYVSGSAALGHTSRAMAQMVGRLLAQAWSGQAAMACASACSQDAAMVAMAADAYQIGGAALQRYGTALAAAQADYDAARKLADQAVADEQAHQQAVNQRMTTGDPVSPADLFWTSPLRSTARARAEQAIADAKAAGNQAAGTLQQTLRPFLPKPKPAPKKPESHWYSPITGFFGGVYDSVKDPVVMVGGLVGLHGDVSDNWSALGKGLAHGFTHPLDFGKAIIDWQDLSQGHYGHWAGELVPSVAAAFFTGGAAGAVKGADALSGVSKAGKALSDMSDAEKAAYLARGEQFVPGSVGLDATKASQLTADGKISYASSYSDELKNFRSIAREGEVTLKEPLYGVNLHNGQIPLGAGRSLKYLTTPDEVLNHTRGGVLQRLALVPQWGPRTHMSIVHLPEGTSVQLAEGPAKWQLSTHKVHGVDVPTGVKVGGGQQILLKEVDRDNVVWTGSAPWAEHAPVAAHLKQATKAGLLVRAPDVLSDVTQPSGQ